MKYSEKLKDPRWQKLRLKIFERDEWACQRCGNTNDMLAVHHLYYKKNKDPWDYPLNAFLTLCQDCHQVEFDERPCAEQDLLMALKVIGFSSSDIKNLALHITESKLCHLPDVVAEVWGLSLSNFGKQRQLVSIYFKELKDVS